EGSGKDMGLAALVLADRLTEPKAKAICLALHRLSLSHPPSSPASTGLTGTDPSLSDSDFLKALTSLGAEATALRLAGRRFIEATETLHGLARKTRAAIGRRPREWAFPPVVDEASLSRIRKSIAETTRTATAVHR